MQGGEAASWNIYVKQPPPGGFRMSGIRWKDAGGGILAEPLWKGSGFRAG